MEDSESPGYCRINDFPDALLLHLLTFLPIKAAVQTSILSRRWRYLRRAIPSLKFDAADFSKKPTPASPLSSPLDATDFFTIVPQFLLSHVSPLNNCTLNVRLGNTSETRVLGDWIRHLLAVKKVKEFSLTAYFNYNPTICYELLFDASDCSSTESLKLQGCVFDCRSDLRLPILKNLSLCHIRMHQEWLRDMFCSCPFLESFSLERCTGSSDNMQISAPKLQNLKIVKSEFINLVVDAPCLQSFEFDCRAKFVAKSCARKLTVTGTRVEVLKACGCALSAFRKNADAKDSPQFSELQRIVIRPCSMNGGHLEDVASLLENGTPPPQLHRLCIDQETACISLSIPITFPEKLLHHLRSVSIYCFKASQEELHRVKIILQAAPSLESLRIARGAMIESQLRIITRELFVGTGSGSRTLRYGFREMISERSRG